MPAARQALLSQTVFQVPAKLLGPKLLSFPSHAADLVGRQGETSSRVINVSQEHTRERSWESMTGRSCAANLINEASIKRRGTSQHQQMNSIIITTTLFQHELRESLPVFPVNMFHVLPAGTSVQWEYIERLTPTK